MEGLEKDRDPGIDGEQEKPGDQKEGERRMEAERGLEGERGMEGEKGKERERRMEGEQGMEGEQEKEGQEIEGNDRHEKYAKENTDNASHMDKDYAWIILVASFGAQFLLTGYIRANGVLFVEFQNKFASSSSMTSLILGIQEAACSISAFIFIGFVLTRTSPRFVFLLGSSCLVLGAAGNAIITNVWLLPITHGVFIGMANGLIYAVSLIVISHWFVQRLSLATSIVMTGASTGGIALPLLTRHLLDTYGFSGGFLLLGGILMHCIIFSFLLVPVQKFFPRCNLEVTPSRKTDRDKMGHDGRHADSIGSNIGGTAEMMSMNQNAGVTEIDCNEICIDKETRNNANHVRLAHHDGRATPQSESGDQGNKKDKRSKVNDFSAMSVSSHNMLSDDVDLFWGIPEQSNIIQRNCFPSSANIGVDIQSHSLQALSHQTLQGRIDDYNAGKNARQEDGSPLLLKRQHPLFDKRRSILFCSTSTLHSLVELSNMQLGTSRPKALATTQQSQNRCLNIQRRICAHPLIRSASFWLLCLYFMVSWTAHIISITYVPALVKERGLTDDDGAFFMSPMSILDFPARLVPGIIVNAGYLKASSICILPMMAVGMAGYFTPFLNSYENLLGLVITYGLFSGVHICMQTLIIIEVVGLKHYPFTLAVSYMFMSIGSTGFFPIAGLMKDNTGTYSTPYFWLATMELLSVVILLCVSRVKKFDVKRGVL